MYIQKANARNLVCFKASSITALLRWSHFLPPQQVIPLKIQIISRFCLLSAGPDQESRWR